MANVPPLAAQDVPSVDETRYGIAPATGTINIGDYLIYSGGFVIATAIGSVTQVRASGAGVAQESNPVYDSNGAARQNTALRFARAGRFRVSAFHNLTASANAPLGTPVYPATTGSGVAAPTGLTGVGAQWATAGKVAAGLGTASGIGVIVGIARFGSASGQTQLDVLLLPPAPDYF